MVLGHDVNPAAVMLPLDGHFQQAHRIRAQADTSLPFRKQAWATLVRHKITAQAETLERVNEPSERLRRLAMAVRSGDPDNREAQPPPFRSVCRANTATEAPAIMKPCFTSHELFVTYISHHPV